MYFKGNAFIHLYKKIQPSEFQKATAFSRYFQAQHMFVKALAEVFKNLWYSQETIPLVYKVGIF